MIKKTIMGVNPGHNGSIALVKDGELVYFTEEERLSRSKYDSDPLLGMIDVLSSTQVDTVIIGGTNKNDLPRDTWSGKSTIEHLASKYNPRVEIIYACDEHHLGHAAGAFYNSGFDTAISVVVDGTGSARNDGGIGGYETESVWVFNYKDSPKLVHKRYYSDQARFESPDSPLVFDDTVTITKAYEAVTDYLGFHFIEAGKVMGLASYGQEEPQLPSLFLNGRGDKNILDPRYPAGSLINTHSNELIRQNVGNYEFHTDPTKLSHVQCNIAYKVQAETQELVGDLIEHAVEVTGVRKVCLSGGYALNCVANYYLKKRFPNIEIYVEPVSSDAGTSIGLAKYHWYQITQDQNIRPQKNVYLGKNYSPEIYDTAINMYKDDLEIHTDITAADVAQIIADKNIVCMYQNGAEAGPRALGNRSILYDPRDPNGKDFVNEIKGREWFRPFAGTILEESASEWFDMAGLNSSPFMMYAVDAKERAKDEVPSIIHVDGTCRIQTVNQKQNKNYYNLISSFNDITGVPVLFNTSFNLAGDPLVETPFDALKTLFSSKLNYLYFPVFGVLLEKKLKVS